MATIPRLSDIARQFRFIGGLPPRAEPEPRDTPTAPPTESNTKAQILSWLADEGVDVQDPATSALTKSELLDQVSDVVNGDVDIRV